MRLIRCIESANARWPLTLALVVALGAVSTIELAYQWDPYTGLRVASAWVTALCIACRRAQPVVTLLIAASTHSLIEVLVGLAGHDTGTPIAQRVAGALLTYAAARWPRPRIAVMALSAAFAMLVLSELSHDGSLVHLVQWPAVMAAAAAMRYREWAIAAAEENVRLVERQRLAEDLHLTIYDRMEQVADRAATASEANGADALSILSLIEDDANNAIEDMRRIVGILHADTATQR